jgi:hypothetical protein
LVSEVVNVGSICVGSHYPEIQVLSWDWEMPLNSNYILTIYEWDIVGFKVDTILFKGIYILTSTGQDVTELPIFLHLLCACQIFINDFKYETMKT